MRIPLAQAEYQSSPELSLCFLFVLKEEQDTGPF